MRIVFHFEWIFAVSKIGTFFSLRVYNYAPCFQIFVVSKRGIFS
jgi:hypothetical protein